MAWTDNLNAAAAAFSAVAAGGAYLAARHSNRTADSVARIERERRQIERTPQIELDLDEDRGLLRVYLNGPDELGRLDFLEITVEDDDMDRTSRFARGTGDPTQEQIDSHVWGPFRFQPTSDGADAHGRTIPGFPLVVGKGKRLAIERTRPGFWMTGAHESWQRQYANHPIRLRLTCRVGEDEWVLARRIDNPPPPGVTT